MTAVRGAALSPASRPALDAVVPVSTRLSPDRIVPLVLAAIALAVAVLTVTPWPVGVFQDDAMYVVLAKALAGGDGFRMISLPGAPHATHFPPVYPLFLAAMWKLYPSFPDNIVAVKFANAVFLAATTLGTYHFSRRRLELGPIGASIGALVGTISVVVLVITGVVLSEPMFMALLIPTLMLVERVADDGRPRTAVAAGAMIGVLSLVRTVGVFALPAVLIVLALRRRWRAAAVLGMVAVAILLPWQLWVSAYQGEVPHPLVGKYGAYGAWLGEGYRAGGLAFARAVLAKNANELFGFLGYTTLPVPPVWPRLISLVTVVGITALGAFALRRRVPVTIAFVGIYLAVILAWPFEPTRFALVWWPVLAPLFVAGVRTLATWRPNHASTRIVRLAAAGAVAMVVCGYGWYNVRGVRDRWWVSIQRDLGSDAKPVAEWVARATQPHDVVITDHELIVYLYTGRRAVPTATFTALGRITPLTAAQDGEVLRTLLDRYHPRWYIAVTQQSTNAAKQLTGTQPPRLRYAGSIPKALIYEPVTP